MKFRTLAVAATTVAAVVGLTGCASGTLDLLTFDHQAAATTPRATSTSAPNVADLPLGAPISKQEAHKLRDVSNPPVNGDYAYQMPDGSWVKTNLHQPLPAVVVAAEQQQANAVPLPTGTDAQDAIAVWSAAKSFAGAFGYATGKYPVFIYHGLQGAGPRGNVPCWQMNGDITSQLPTGGNVWPTADAAVAAADAMIAKQPNPADYAVIVQGR